MSAPPEIIQIVDRFDAGFNEYKQAKYGETQVRVDFINPFFEALGWDMSNKNRREVTHEYALDDLASKIHPDYSFNAGGEGKIFFLEAKKPSVNLLLGLNPALQIRRYSWTANHSIGALTDFEELSVYYGRGIEPKNTDGPDVARMFYCNFREYADKWDEIHAMFSRQAVLDGSLERHAAAMKTKRGSQEVDAVFLNDIEAWRLLLAGHIASNNPELTQRELNALVQQTIDRIIFLRICEDRDIEPYGTLEKLLSSESVYQQLVRLFKSADSKYNSGLFYFKNDTKRKGAADTLALDLKIQDEPLKQIIQRLYFPHGPYAFSVMPADILGQVYERFLGKAIQVQPDRSVVVEEKPEVRKAGGVYYTPTYIVDYIVRSTVGKLVEGKVPDDISSMRVLDPACGSGSFLIRAYQYLLDWHLDWYLNNDPPKHIKCKPPKLYQDSNDRWHLAIHERKRILLNNIYGVDIDSQAVEVSKLSLLLKVLEGENSQSMTRQLSLFKERALPDLGDNIKCGNSLIGRDFYSGQQSLITFDERLKINAFDWEIEFADIMKAGGFDAVIGNPPYVLIGSDKLSEQSYLNSSFDLTSYKTNTYILFLNKGLNLLNSNGSILGYIIPKSLVFNTYFSKARYSMMKKYAITQIVEIQDRVFQNAEVGDSLLFFAQTCLNPENNSLKYYRVKNIHPVFNLHEKFESIQKDLLKYSDSLFYQSALSIKSSSVKLYEILCVSNGLNPGNVKHILISDTSKNEKYKKMVLGRDIKKYSLSWSGSWVNYDPELKNKITLADIKSKAGMTSQQKVDFALRNPEIFTPNKILIRKTADKIIASYDPYGYCCDSLAYSVQLLPQTRESIFYFLGVLNSKLMEYIHQGYSMNKNKVFAKVLAVNLKKLPIRPINFLDPADVSRHDRMVALVQKMLDLHKQLSTARAQQEIVELTRDIEATDKEIDRLVYELYDLTDDEIAIVVSERKPLTI